MDTSTGHISRIKSEEEYRALMEEQLEALRAERVPARMLIPDDQEERVVNMNRQQRRAWARQEAKRLAKDAR